MKIKRYIASDMRSAMAQIKQELGADAMILSNNRMGNKVEVICAIDYDEAMLQQSWPGKNLTAERQLARQENGGFADALADVAARQKPVGNNNAVHGQSGRWAESQDAALLSMREELQAMKATLEQHLDNAQWNVVKRSYPHLAAVLSKLKFMGIHSRIAEDIVRCLPDDTRANDAFRTALGLVTNQLPTQAAELDAGGVIALVGATGVGKTTTIAKMATRFAMRHGSHNVALISTDEMRIGAYEQLNVYGQILGVPVYRAADQMELDLLLNKLRNKRLVLIDTQGFCRQGRALPEQLAMLRRLQQPVSTYLLISADMQQAIMEESIHIYRQLGLAGMILTKLDEAVEYGSALSVLIENGLPLMYVSDGQAIPDSLREVNAQQLVFRALKLAKERVALHKPEAGNNNNNSVMGGAIA